MSDGLFLTPDDMGAFVELAGAFVGLGVGLGAIFTMLGLGLWAFKDWFRGV